MFNDDYLNISQNGVIIVLRPDLIDYETNQQFDIVIIAYDLVLPENQRRQVRFADSSMYSCKVDAYFKPPLIRTLYMVSAT